MEGILLTVYYETENLRLKTTPYFRVRRRPQKYAQPFFFVVVLLRDTRKGLSEIGATRSLDTSKGEIVHVAHVWK